MARRCLAEGPPREGAQCSQPPKCTWEVQRTLGVETPRAQSSLLTTVSALWSFPLLQSWDPRWATDGLCDGLRSSERSKGDLHTCHLRLDSMETGVGNHKPMPCGFFC